MAGIGVYAADGTGVQVWRFAAIYFVVCYLSIACWAYAGAFLRAWLRDARRVRIFNRWRCCWPPAPCSWSSIEA